VIQLHAEPDDYFFKNSLGDPIDQRSFYKIFWAAQRALSIRLRDLCATKDTYVSTALTSGVNLAWLSQQTGVMESTLRSHYGRFIHASHADAWNSRKSIPRAQEEESLLHACPTQGQASGKSL
jgi:hypothetical protein